MELSLPEVKENENELSENKSGEESPNEISTNEVATKEHVNNRRRKMNSFDKNQTNQTASNECRKNNFNSSPINLKRFISNTDSASFYNVPFNLEPIEFNLRNSLIKKCSDVYRKQQSFRNKSKSHDKRCSTSFFNYLSYLTSIKLFKNSILMMLNISFLFVMIGMCVPLIYLKELVVHKSQGKVSKTESVYFLSMVGLMIGIGRIISSITYKVNVSNAKNRIFSYNLTLILSGLTLISSTYLCDTLFSFTFFSTMFGILLGE
jgi:hypothetical protein